MGAHCRVLIRHTIQSRKNTIYNDKFFERQAYNWAASKTRTRSDRNTGFCSVSLTPAASISCQKKGGGRGISRALTTKRRNHHHQSAAATRAWAIPHKQHENKRSTGHLLSDCWHSAPIRTKSRHRCGPAPPVLLGPPWLGPASH